MKKLVLLFALSIISFYACSTDDPVYDHSDNSWNIGVIGGDNQNVLYLINQPTGAISVDDIYFKANNDRINTKINSVQAYGNKLYVFCKNDYKIIVLNRSSYAKEFVFDFSADKLMPKKLAFINASSGILIFESAKFAKVIDLYNNSVAKTIDLPDYSGDIAFAGNYVYISNPTINKVSFISSKTYEYKGEIQTSDVPYYLAATNISNNIVLVGLGHGRIDNATPTESKVSIINTSNNSISYSAEVKYSVVDSKSHIVNGIAISSKDMAFISTSNGLFLLNTKYPNGTSLIKKDKFEGVVYNSYKDILVTFIGGSSRKTYAASPNNGSFLYNLALPVNYTNIFFE
jgi:hypothetical protein